MNYKAIIFDFNGTLFFDNDKHVLAWGKISKLIRGRGISDEELHEQFNGTPNAKNIQYMMNNQATSEELKKYSLLKEEYYREFCKQDKASFHLVDGAVAFFDKLKELGIPFTIASASIKENIDFFVDGSYSNKVNMFKDAAQKLKHNVKDILVFEDSFSGIANAYKAGIEKIVVICPQEKESEYRDLPGVIMTIQDFSDFNKLI